MTPETALAFAAGVALGALLSVAGQIRRLRRARQVIAAMCLNQPDPEAHQCCYDGGPRCLYCGRRCASDRAYVEMQRQHRLENIEQAKKGLPRRWAVDWDVL